MKNFKRVAALVLAVVSAFTVTACNNEGTGQSDDVIEIRFATWDSAESLDMQQELVDRFNDQHDDINVTLEAYGGDFDTTITVSIGGNNAPDVMYMWNYPAYGDALLPLDDLIASEGAEYKENFYETLWNYNSIGGDILGIPVGYTTHVLYYNKDLFDAKDLDYPTDDWTWDDVRVAAEALTDESTNTYGIALPVTFDPYDAEMFAWSNGGSFSDSDGNYQGVLNSPETVAPFAYMQEMILDGIALGTSDTGQENFRLGTIGMYINGAWSLGRLDSDGMNYGVALLPDFGGNQSQSVVSSSGLSIYEGSDNPEAAWEFVKFWTGEEMNLERIEYELPVLKSVVEQEGLEEDPVKEKFYQMLERSDEHMPASFLIPNWSDLSGEIQLALESIININSAADPQAAFDAAAAR